MRSRPGEPRDLELAVRYKPDRAEEPGASERATAGKPDRPAGVQPAGDTGGRGGADWASGDDPWSERGSDPGTSGWGKITVEAGASTSARIGSALLLLGLFLGLGFGMLQAIDADNALASGALGACLVLVVAASVLWVSAEARLGMTPADVINMLRAVHRAKEAAVGDGRDK